MARLTNLRNLLALLFVGPIVVIASNFVGAKNDDKKSDEKKPDPHVLAWDKATARNAVPGDDELQRLRIARYNAALVEFKAHRQELLAGRVTPDEQLPCADRLRESALALSRTRAERIVIHEQAVEFGKSVEHDTKANFETIAKQKDEERSLFAQRVGRVADDDPPNSGQEAFDASKSPSNTLLPQVRQWRANAELRLQEEKGKK
jgi:hypothetical protein